jgi:ubiquinone/menaquinone biosynthesis C-methylase UbiE
MPQIDLLRALPHTKRNIKKREEAKDPKVIEIARQYGEIYFDGPREFGYGGYRYDGRWIPVARDIVKHFGLKPGDRILDIGCAKGFLVKDLMQVMPGLQAFGLDISEYALIHCEPEVVGRLHLGDCRRLPFPDGSFDAVICLNTIHNLIREDAVTAMGEIERLAPGKGFVQVDSYLTPEQKSIFESWVLTAKFHDYPEGWIELFAEAGFTGDYYWTIIE